MTFIGCSARSGFVGLMPLSRTEPTNNSLMHVIDRFIVKISKLLTTTDILK